MTLRIFICFENGDIIMEEIKNTDHNQSSISKEFTHFDHSGNAIMVDVSEKNNTERTARASGRIYMCPELLDMVLAGKTKKGNVLGVAQVAGIMATKRTSDLIPMCHPLMLNKVSLEFHIEKEAGYIEAICMAKLVGKTGVEMEALTGVSVALLTIYDMCKAVDRSMTIEHVHLLEKHGGKSDYLHNIST